MNIIILTDTALYQFEQSSTANLELSVGKGIWKTITFEYARTISLFTWQKLWKFVGVLPVNSVICTVIWRFGKTES